MKWPDKSPLFVFVLLLLYGGVAFALEEVAMHSATTGMTGVNLVAEKVQPVGPVQAVANPTMAHLSMEDAAEMGWLRVFALVSGIAALGFTFYHALGRRPNSAHR